jgi:hypothetical protein
MSGGNGIGAWGTPHATPGHNSGPAPETQWQVPHKRGDHDPDHDHDHETAAAEPDFDLVEASFVEGFWAASDPTSFLRLAGVPFHGRDGTGRVLALLRVEQEQTADVAAVTPQLDGQGMRTDPLPASRVARRRRVRLVYLDGTAPVRLTLAEARALEAVS